MSDSSQPLTLTDKSNSNLNDQVNDKANSQSFSPQLTPPSNNTNTLSNEVHHLNEPDLTPNISLQSNDPFNIFHTNLRNDTELILKKITEGRSLTKQNKEEIINLIRKIQTQTELINNVPNNSSTKFLTTIYQC